MKTEQQSTRKQKPAERVGRVKLEYTEGFVTHSTVAQKIQAHAILEQILKLCEKRLLNPDAKVRSPLLGGIDAGNIPELVSAYKYANSIRCYFDNPLKQSGAHTDIYVKFIDTNGADIVFLSFLIESWGHIRRTTYV